MIEQAGVTFVLPNEVRIHREQHDGREPVLGDGSDIGTIREGPREGSGRYRVELAPAGWQVVFFRFFPPQHSPRVKLVRQFGIGEQEERLARAFAINRFRRVAATGKETALHD